MSLRAWRIIKRILGVIIILGSIFLAGYVGLWEMFIEPIINACQHFDAGTLNATILATTVLKCVFASTVGGLILAVGPQFGLALIVKD
jgi:hypothetical protein